ncbi:MAG: methyltransferase, partial [Thermomicrobiales bacterium]
EYQAMFNQAMSEGTRNATPGIAEAGDFARFTWVVDVGGGDGTLLAGVLAAHPHLRGTVFDTHDGMQAAPGTLTRAGLADRAAAEAGDFFAAVPSDGDAYVLCRILHDWDDAAAGRLLERCRAAMPASARLLVVDKLLPERVADNPSAIFLDLDMLVEVGGRQRSAAEYRTLLARHGFHLEEVVDRAPASSVLVARPVT